MLILPWNYSTLSKSNNTHRVNKVLRLDANELIISKTLEKLNTPLQFYFLVTLHFLLTYFFDLYALFTLSMIEFLMKVRVNWCYLQIVMIEWRCETMGNNNSIRINPSGNEGNSGSRILLFLHRTWTVIVTEKWRTRVNRNCDSVSEYGSQMSQYSFCSCSQCQRDDGFSSGGYR